MYVVPSIASILRRGMKNNSSLALEIKWIYSWSYNYEKQKRSYRDIPIHFNWFNLVTWNCSCSGLVQSKMDKNIAKHGSTSNEGNSGQFRALFWHLLIEMISSENKANCGEFLCPTVIFLAREIFFVLTQIFYVQGHNKRKNKRRSLREAATRVSLNQFNTKQWDYVNVIRRGSIFILFFG